MISSWLAKVRPPKYLRYFFYISYRWYTGYESERYVAHISAVLFLAFAHMFFLFWLIFFTSFEVFMANTNKYMGMIPIFIFLAVTHYYLFFYKKKWKKYVQEFRNLTTTQRKKGTFLLFLYLLFSIALFASPIYFGEKERNKIREEKIKVESTRVYNSYGIAKCVLVDKGNGEDFAFFEFFLDGQKVKGATEIPKGSGEGLQGKYFEVNYSSIKPRENVLLVKKEIIDDTKIKMAGFD